MGAASPPVEAPSSLSLALGDRAAGQFRHTTPPPRRSFQPGGLAKHTMPGSRDTRSRLDQPRSFSGSLFLPWISISSRRSFEARRVNARMAGCHSRSSHEHDTRSSSERCLLRSSPLPAGRDGVARERVTGFLIAAARSASASAWVPRHPSPARCPCARATSRRRSYCGRRRSSGFRKRTPAAARQRPGAAKRAS
jgi:hypothetical protein